jgi:hypothetical protein
VGRNQRRHLRDEGGLVEGSSEDPGDLDDAPPQAGVVARTNDFMEPSDNLLEGCAVIASRALFDLMGLSRGDALLLSPLRARSLRRGWLVKAQVFLK